MNEYNAKVHWAKIELPNKGYMTNDEYNKRLQEIQNSIKQGYPINEYNNYRNAIDPNGILSNNIIDTLFDTSSSNNSSNSSSSSSS